MSERPEMSDAFRANRERPEMSDAIRAYRERHAMSDARRKDRTRPSASGTGSVTEAGRAKRARPAISIQVATPSGNPRQWTLAGAGLYAAALVVILTLSAVCYLAMRNAALANIAREADRIAAKNRELEQTTQELATLQQELAEMHRVDSEIRALLGLPTAEPRASVGGVGAQAGADARAGATPGDDHAAAPSLPLTPEERAILAAPDPRARVLADESARLARLGLFAWPIEGWVSSEFGDARAGDEAHNGLDIAAPAGAAVFAAANGEIVVAGIDSLYGRVVVIDHGDGLRSVYGHNASLAVRRGDRVERGETIATVGSTGQSTAPHLHFELRRGNEMLDPRDVLPPVRDAVARSR